MFVVGAHVVAAFFLPPKQEVDALRKGTTMQILSYEWNRA